VGLIIVDGLRDRAGASSFRAWPLQAGCGRLEELPQRNGQSKADAAPAARCSHQESFGEGLVASGAAIKWRARPGGRPHAGERQNRLGRLSM
jgi:hypothetical protein